jgi:hypothetical protein
VIPWPSSVELPPRKVEYARDEPVGASLVTKASVPPLYEVSKAPGVVGKPVDCVEPVT